MLLGEESHEYNLRVDCYDSIWRKECLETSGLDRERDSGEHECIDYGCKRYGRQ